MNCNSFNFLMIAFISLVSCADSNKSIEKPVLVENTEVTQLPYFNTAIFTPEWEKGNHKIPEFSFTNQVGDEVTNKTFEGKIYVADFFFTICPGICPKLTKHMGLLQKEYQNDRNIKLISHSVMPWNDTVAALATYAEEHKVQLPQWNLVTGDKDELYAIARNGYFADEDFVKTQDETNFIHTENFVLVDKEGYIRGVYNGTLALEVKRLIRHIKILKKEL